MYTKKKEKWHENFLSEKVFHQQQKLAQKMTNDDKSLSYTPSSYFMRKINAFRPQRSI